MSESTRGHWDRFWREHDAIDQVYSNEDRIVNELRKMSPKGKIALEVGAGSGRDSLELVRMGARVIVLDYSRPALVTARRLAERLDLELLVVCGDALSLPFRNDSIDIVFHQGLLEHFRDPMPLLSENARVVAKGGHLLVDVPQTIHPYTLLKHVLMAIGKWFAGWETEFTIGELEGLIRRTGLGLAWSYGGWMVPGLWYRGVRAVLRRIGWVLPKYPRGVWPFNATGAWLRRHLSGTRLAFYTYAMIGSIGRKRE